MKGAPMTTILLIIIYITFIGLGIPDSLFGTAWPAIYQEFHLPISYAGFVTCIISGGTIISSLFSAGIIRRFKTARVTAFSTALTAAALFGFSQAHHMAALCLSAVPLGLGAGAIDTALNHYVALHYKAVHMNFLHCFYGIGVSLSPWLMSLMLANSAGWRNGYFAVFLVQSAIAVLSISAIPLWGKVSDAAAEENKPALETGIFDLLKERSVRRVCLVFLGSCAIEYTCGVWGSTFLVNAKGMSVDAAAKIIALYYAGMACGRFLSGVLAYWLHSRQMIRAGQSLMLFAVVLLVLPLPPFAAGAALFFTGLGNAPVFPNMLHLTPEVFGAEKSQSVIGIEMSASYTSILLAPVVFGWAAQHLQIWLFPYYICILFALMMCGTVPKPPRHSRSHIPS